MTRAKCCPSGPVRSGLVERRSPRFALFSKCARQLHAPYLAGQAVHYESSAISSPTWSRQRHDRAAPCNCAAICSHCGLISILRRTSNATPRHARGARISSSRVARPGLPSPLRSCETGASASHGSSAVAGTATVCDHVVSCLSRLCNVDCLMVGHRRAFLAGHESPQQQQRGGGGGVGGLGKVSFFFGGVWVGWCIVGIF